ncbi:MAG: anaerobic ribonucleoside-triphosphate reductase [Treponema sp.]|nr:anaerobic ribonucleoside-triphosphate reductase [Treponema sp.]
MRNLEVIERELSAAREALSNVRGTPTEVYSRIVGYYRSVRNWNKGKREEYGERVLFKPDASLLASCVPSGPAPAPGRRDKSTPRAPGRQTAAVYGGPALAGPGADKTPSAGWGEGGKTGAESRVLLFVRPACPACPPAKAAAGKLGIPMELYDADTDEGLAEAVRRNVMSTPMAILLSPAGEELGRARDPETIGRLLTGAEPIAV